MKSETYGHNLLIGLLAAAAISLAWFDVYPYFGYAKALTTLAVLLLFYRFAHDLTKYEFGLGLVGLIFCLFGDVALIFDEWFTVGLVCFLTGHILFIVLFSRLAYGVLSWIAVIMVFSVSIGYFVFISAGLASMAIPVAAYVTVISLMAAWGISLHKQIGNTGSLLVMLGGLLFLVSDGVLSYNRFVSSVAIFHPIVLSTYWLSLALIANGLVRIRSS